MKCTTDKVFETLTSYSENLADDICNMSILDRSQIITKLATVMKMAFSDMLKNSINEMAAKKNLLYRQLQFEARTPREKTIIQAQIEKIAWEMKSQNRALHALEDHSDYERLKTFVINKFGSAVLNEFYINKNQTT